MNKKFVEDNIGKAKEAIETVPGVLDKENRIDKTMRSKMAAFGAAVYMSGLMPAIAYYNKKEKTEKTEKEDTNKYVIKLLARMYANDADLYETVSKEKNKQEAREKILGYAVCLKLAMNLFELKEN